MEVEEEVFIIAEGDCTIKYDWYAFGQDKTIGSYEGRHAS